MCVFFFIVFLLLFIYFYFLFFIFLSRLVNIGRRVKIFELTVCLFVFVVL